ncbi:D-alanyl-D-alanine carboxypeptidase [Streptomyces sp. p1417]|uniref:D-alanyl-D-alanine carboxypeptidase n=1 Tax=Streptomyces typhae TaxID=2681492 RepID=A0A6L6X2Z1_9ACTN|nr:serine hydrolase [Streptomyces typhae]MVO88185.1 D-alanyl-D-alanine carboxypeptidase [Streptomyces typhae]
MVIRYLSRPLGRATALRATALRAAALATGASVCLAAPAAGLSGPAAGAEPAPPKPLSAYSSYSSSSPYSSYSSSSRYPSSSPYSSYSSSLLDRPGTQVRPAAGAPPAPRDLTARSWLVSDARTGEVLAAHNAHRRLPPASTLKSLFALAALDRLHPETPHTVTHGELRKVGGGSSLVGVDAGRSYRVADLWRGVFLSSGNDAVHVLAEMNGGWRHTVRQMRAKARELGARDTHVVSPDGYDAPGQVSSAFDLAVFGRAGLADPQFARYCSTARARFPQGNWSYPIQNTNRLLTGADGVERYPGLIGVKNGYTSGAGHTLIAAAHRGTRTVLVTVMNPSRGGFAVYEEARSLLDWGFAAVGRVQPVGSLLPAKPRKAPDRDQRTAAAAIVSSAASDDGSDWPALVLVGVGSAAVLAGCLVIVRRRRAATVARRRASGGEFFR